MAAFARIAVRPEATFSMLQDLRIKYRDWVFEPIDYSSVYRPVEIIRPAEARSLTNL
jgi:hypothetical protein